MAEFLALQYRMGKISQSQLMQAVNRRIITAAEFEKIIERGE